MFVRVSELLEEKIAQALSGTDSCVFIPQCVLHNGDTDFEYECINVRAINIKQDFENEFMDTVSVTVDITPEAYMELLKNIQNLDCSLILTPYNPTTQEYNYDQDPVVINMKVFTEHQTDLEKMMGIHQLKDTELPPENASQAGMLVPYTFYLISKEMHDIRQINVNALLKECTMEDVLYWACQQFGITNAEIIPPDNKEKYSIVIIPPMHNFATLFPYLQERYGIYSKGLGYYYVNDTLYIYPEYDTAQKTSTSDGVIQLVNVPPNNRLGIERYHAYDDDDLLIAAVGQTKTEPRNAIGAENLGTVHISTNSDSMRDQFVTIDGSGKVSRSKDDIVTISLQNDAGNATPNMQNVRYAGERTNIYSSTSTLASVNGTTLTTPWVRSIPWAILPGQNVTYHFDSQEEVYRTQNGRILGTLTSSNTHAGAYRQACMTFSTVLVVFLDPDKASEESIQYVG